MLFQGSRSRRIEHEPQPVSSAEAPQHEASATVPKLTQAELFAKACKECDFWFHSVPFGEGRFTRGHKTQEQMEAEAAQWRFPSDLAGKTMLDIGCADGGWSVEALARGAASVVAIDEQTTVGRKFLMENAAFPEIAFATINLYSDEFLKLAPVDFVLFAGVLYHVHDPIEALRRVRLKTKESAILETHVNHRFGTDTTYAVFYERDEFSGDPTNWWGPNIPCLEAWLRVAGFRFEMTSLQWENERNGRVSYMLWPV